jgi:hypothetical protein
VLLVDGVGPIVDETASLNKHAYDGIIAGAEQYGKNIWKSLKYIWRSLTAWRQLT